MKRINVSFVYSLASAIHPLVVLKKDTRWVDALAHFFFGKDRLNNLIESAPVVLKTCLPEAKELRDYIAELEEVSDRRVASNPTAALNVFEASRLRHLASQFETTLAADLRDLEIYFVSPVGIFSTTSLLSKPEDMFFDKVKDLPEDTLREIQEGGKCLAFALATASAFHFLRALESIIRKYYDVLSSGAPRPTRGSMGVYLDKLLELPDVDKDLESVLRQIKKLHRDPISHPEVTLTVPEAVSLLGLIQSAISRILDLIKPKP
ncbi:MAG TPA: hypothetical protein VG103_08235 [Chthoniobacterales bacterium]|nr:hypothetical protein [Chthoniobacterales bacterium]